MNQPPSDVEAEIAVLAAVLIDNDRYTEVAPILSDTDFYREVHRRIWRAVSALRADSEPVDPVTLAAKLTESGELDASGGVEYLATLIGAIPSTVNTTSYAQIVSDMAAKRRVIEAASLLIRDAHEMPLDQLSSGADKLISTLGGSAQGGFSRVKNSLWPAIEAIEDMHTDNGVRGLLTGFADLDAMLVGFEPGDLIVVAARPSMGKTAFVLNVLANLAISDDVPVGLVSLEMNSKALTMRMIASEARVDFQGIRNGRFDPSMSERIAKAAGHLDVAPMFIDDNPVANFAGLAAKATRLVRSEGVKLLAIDYLQLMSGDGENRNQEISKLTRDLKTLAMSLGIPIILLSQLSRKVEERKDKRPMLSDLRDSGSIEQDADVVMFLYRAEYYATTDEARLLMSGSAEVIMAKQRNGPTGICSLAFSKECARFDSLERRIGVA